MKEKECPSQIKIKSEIKAQKREEAAARRKQYFIEYREKNREKIRAYQRAYQEKNREKNRKHKNAYMRMYHQKNREVSLMRQKEYYAKNREKIIAKSIEYKRKNPERYRIINQRHYKKNYEKIKLTQKEYREKNKEKYVQYKREYWEKNKYKLCYELLNYYCFKSMEEIQKQCPKRVEKYLTRYPFEKYAEKRIRRELYIRGVYLSDSKYADCYDAGMLAYMYSIHRCAYLACDYTIPYIRKMIRIYVLCALIVYNEIGNICRMNQFKEYRLDRTNVPQL